VRGVKPVAVVFDTGGERSVVVVQAEHHFCVAPGVFSDVLDRLQAREVHGRLGFLRAARRGPFQGHVHRCPRRLRAQRFSDAELGERRRVDPVRYLAQGVKHRRGMSGQRGERAGGRGQRVTILLGKAELDDQRYKLVLYAVVQVSFQAPALVLASEGGTRLCDPRRLRWLRDAPGGHPRSQLAAVGAELFDLAGEFAVSGLEREASTAQRRQRLDETVAGCPLGSPVRADLVTLLTRLSDCCGLCICENGPAICRIAR